MKLNKLFLGIFATLAIAACAHAQMKSGVIEQLPVRTLAYVLGHNGGGFVGREPVADFIKPGSTSPTNGKIATWGSSGNLTADGEQSLPVGAIVGTTDAHALPNKMLPSPVISNPSITGTVNLGGLTASSAIATDSSNNLVSVSNKGTGNNVHSTSPTLVSPALGGPSPVVLANATVLPLTSVGTGTLPNTARPPALGNGTSLYPSVANSIITTATSTSGSPTITVTSAGGLAIGLSVDQSGAFGFVAGTVITNISGTTVTASNNAMRTHSTATTIKFGSDRWSVTSSTLTNTVGAQTGYFGGASQGAIPSWIYQYDPASSYPTISSLVSSNQGGWRAASFYARLSDAAADGANVIETIVNLCNVDVGRTTPAGYSTWCQYEQGNLTSAIPGYHINKESDLWSGWTPAGVDPYSYNPVGHTTLERLTSGDGQHLGAQNISSYIELINNGAAARSGIVFGNNSLDTASGRIAPAIAMAPSHSLTWYSATNTRSWQIYSTATSGSNSLILKPAEATLSTAFGINGANGSSTRITNIYTAGSLRWTAGATSTLESGSNAGSDWALAAFSDSGTFVNVPILVNRGIGNVTFSSLVGKGNRAVCTTAAGIIYAAASTTCP